MLSRLCLLVLLCAQSRRPQALGRSQGIRYLIFQIFDQNKIVLYVLYTWWRLRDDWSGLCWNIWWQNVGTITKTDISCMYTMSHVYKHVHDSTINVTMMLPG